MAALTLQTLDETGLDPTLSNSDVGSGDTVKNIGGDVFLYFINLSGSDSATVTITAQETSTTKPSFGPVTKANIVLTLALGTDKMVGPFPRKAFNDASGNVNIAYTGVAAADVDVAALQIAGIGGIA